MDPERREALIAQLSSPEEEERRMAMEALKGSLSEADLPWLMRPLSDESWRVRKESIEGLSLLDPTPGLVARIVPLMDPERELTLRNSVVEVLERMGVKVAPLLVGHLGVDQADVRKFLVDILGNIADPSTLPALAGLLNDPEDNIKAAAAEALASLGDPSVCADLLRAMEGSDDWVAYSIIGSLARLQCEQALPVFFQYLTNPFLAKPALTGIGAMGSLQDGVRLTEMIPSLSRGAVKSIYPALGSIYRRSVSRMDMEEAAQALTRAVRAAADETVLQFLTAQVEVSDQLESRQNFLAVLGLIGGPVSLEAVLGCVEDEALTRDVDLALLTLGRAEKGLILGLLDHPNPLVRQRGIGTLERLGGTDSLNRLYDLLEDESGHVRKDAAGAVSLLGNPGSVARLLPLLDDEYRDVAQAAAQALVKLGQRSPLETASAITPRLASAPPAQKGLLIWILTEVRAPGWEKLCLRAAQDTEPEVRAAAVSCLKHSGDQAAVATVINSLTDEVPEVRVQAVMALEVMKSGEALQPLRAALHDHDPWVRAAAVSSLSVQPGADPRDLEELLEGEDLMMRTSVVDALGRMAAAGGKGALDLLLAQYEGGTLEIRRSVCRILGKAPQEEALQLLIRASTAEDPSIRTFACHSLSQRQEAQALEALREAAEKDPDRQVRETVRTLLEARK